MKTLRLLLAISASLLVSTVAFAQETDPDTSKVMPSLEHVGIFTSAGEELSMDGLLDALVAANPGVVYVGEQHNDPVGHFVEFELLKGLHGRAGDTRPVALAMEMFERDVQVIMDEFLSDKIREKDLKDAGRPWKNYDQDYKPMVDYAKSNELAVIAANAPARYVFHVGREGQASLESVGAVAKSWLPPLPFFEGSEAYTSKFNKTMEDMAIEMQRMMAEQKAADGDSTDLMALESDDPPPPQMHSNPNSVVAQSLRDAAMGYSVVEYLLANPDAMVVHVNGSFHSEERMGIPEHVERYRPGTHQKVITMVVVDDVSAFDPEEHAHLGDYIVLTDASLPRSY